MKKSNKGFTLLELLIAVAVLAIIIAPMLRGFVTSHRVNAKSRHLMRATTLAQNEMEIFEKEKLEDLLADTALPTPQFGYTVVTKPDETDASDPGIYVFERDGIINDDSGMDMFDVRVTLNPERVSASDLYYDQNSREVLFMNTVSGIDSATYIQRVRNQVNTAGDDEQVYKHYQTVQHPDGVGGVKWTEDDFRENLERTITLTIRQEDQGGVMVTVAEIEYAYSIANNYGIVPDKYEKYTKKKIFFNNAQTLDGEGRPVDLKSVYLYYAPRYRLRNNAYTGAVNKDSIIINNTAGLPVNIYLIRQNIHTADWIPTDDTVDANGKVTIAKIEGVYEDDTGVLQNTVPADYKAYVTINEGFTADGKTHGKYFTNLNLNLPSADNEFKVGSPADFTLNECDAAGNVLSTITGAAAVQAADMRSLNPKVQADGSATMGSLGSAEIKDRIYTMETAVYDHGADPLTSDPVVSLTGTKIE